jgi:hypothetical protein
MVVSPHVSFAARSTSTPREHRAGVAKTRRVAVLTCSPLAGTWNRMYMILIAFRILSDVAMPLFDRRLVERTNESASPWRVITAADAGVRRLATIRSIRSKTLCRSRCIPQQAALRPKVFGVGSSADTVALRALDPRMP